MRAIGRFLIPLIICIFLIACGGDGSKKRPPRAPEVTVDADIKQLIFSWEEVPKATHYRLFENPDGHSGFTQAGNDIPSGTLSVTKEISVHLHDWVNALYMVQACNTAGCTGSTEVTALDLMLSTIGYFKSPSTTAGDYFGSSVAMSGDGNTLAIGSPGSHIDIGQGQQDVTLRAGAVYLFQFDGANWSQFAQINASNADLTDWFGETVALSADGSTLAVGAAGERSSATGINGDQSDNSALSSGAVYVFRLNGTDWFQQAYIKASNTEAYDHFSHSIDLSADGNTMAVSATLEASGSRGINAYQDNNWAPYSGAVYLFRFDGTEWFQQVYIKASNADPDDGFGRAMALSADGDTLAVGAPGEDSRATGINGDQSDALPMRVRSGATYVFRFNGTDWFQQTYIKASNPSNYSGFGHAVALGANGSTLAVVGGKHGYIFRFDGTDWFEQAFVTASVTETAVGISNPASLSADGNTLAVGGTTSSCATGVNGDQNRSLCGGSGAAYIFRFDGTNWSELAYVKATNTDSEDRFSNSLALSADGSTLAVGAWEEESAGVGINGDQTDNSARSAGAVYVY